MKNYDKSAVRQISAALIGYKSHLFVQNICNLMQILEMQQNI